MRTVLGVAEILRKFAGMKKIVFLTAVLCMATVVLASPKTARKARAAAPDLSALFEKAEEALMLYDANGLEENVDNISEVLERQKNPSAEHQAALRTLQNRLIAMRNMLGRVEQLVILDSLSLPRDRYLEAYALSGDAGRIAGPDSALSFTPAAGREVFFTRADSAGRLHIMHAGILDDGTREEAVLLRLFGDESIETAWPFMLADGTTLYFAARTDNDSSLGGFDIYMTRRDDQDGFLEPTNVGMPYNSPANDFMFALDEASGLGYFATDRDAPDDMVTVYIFRPNESRVNYPADCKDISDRAFITSVSATQPEGLDAAATLADARHRAATRHGASMTQSFSFSLGNGTVYTDPSQFTSQQARRLLDKYTDEADSIAGLETSLDAMRGQYAAGNVTLRGRILAAEKQLRQLRRRHIATGNAIVRAETRK